MKKIFLLLLIILCVAGCGENKNIKTENINIGMISKLNASEEAINNHFKKIEESDENSKLSHKYFYYDDLNNLIAASESGKIDEISIYKCVADYIAAKNPDIKILADHSDLSDSFCFAVLKDNQRLLLEIDLAIQEMKDDGTLNKIAQEYIIDLKTVAIANIDGAETVKVGITGDLPPLDYVNAEGQAAGFNTAVLSELGKRMNKNIELVKISDNTRAAALLTKNIDVLFLVSVPDTSLIPEDIDVPKELAVSIPYYTDKIVHVSLKK